MLLISSCILLQKQEYGSVGLKRYFFFAAYGMQMVTVTITNLLFCPLPIWTAGINLN